jgi:YbbR domain-containing protein
VKVLTRVRQNLAALVLAVTLSFLLWSLAVSQRNPDRTDFLPQTLTIVAENLPAGLVLANPRSLPEVRVRITAPSDHFQRVRQSNFEARVDLSGATPGTRQYPVQVETTDRRVQLVSWEPEQVSLTIERLTRKDVPVQVNIDADVPFGFLSRQPRATPEIVTVSGPESAIETVSIVTINVNLSNERRTFSADLAPIPRSADGAVVRGVTITPQRVHVEVPIEQQAAYRVVPVVPAVVGAPRSGYQVVGIAADPTSVTVVGDPSIVQNLQFVQTESVDVNHAAGDIIQNVRVRLPAGVSLVREQTVTVRVQVAPLIGSQVMRVAPTVVNLSEQYRASVSPGAVEVLVRGPMPALLTLQPRDIRLTADLSGRGPGVHNVRLAVDAPSALVIERIDPERVLVTVAVRE